MTPLLVAVGFATGAALATGHAQPVPVPPTYTAFPDLKTPTRPAELPGGTKGTFPDYEALYARLRAVADRSLPPDAAPAARVRSFQLKAGTDYLLKVHRTQQAQNRCFAPSELAELTEMVNTVYRAAVGGEPDA